MKVTLTGEDIYRMECIAVPCPSCKSFPGEPCKGKNVAYYKTCGHVDRKNAFKSWRMRNEDAYRKLRSNIERFRMMQCETKNNELYMGEN